MLKRTEPGELLLYAVDHDRAARIDPGIMRPLPVGGIWIGDMQGKMEPTLRVLLIDHIFAFRRFVVALPLLGSARFAESDAVGLEGLPIRHRTIVCFDCTMMIRSALSPSEFDRADEHPSPKALHSRLTSNTELQM